MTPTTRTSTKSQTIYELRGEIERLKAHIGIQVAIIETLNYQIQSAQPSQIAKKLQYICKPYLQNGYSNTLAKILHLNLLAVADNPSLLIASCHCLANDHHYEMAHRFLTEILEKDPENLEVRRARLDIFLKEYKFDLALTEAQAILVHLEKAEAGMPISDPEVIVILANLHIVKNNHKEATRVIKKALTLFPGDAPLLNLYTKLKSPLRWPLDPMLSEIDNQEQGGKAAI